MNIHVSNTHKSRQRTGRSRLAAPKRPRAVSARVPASPSERGNRLFLASLYLAFAIGSVLFLLIMYAIIMGGLPSLGP